LVRKRYVSLTPLCGVGVKLAAATFLEKLDERHAESRLSLDEIERP